MFGRYWCVKPNLENNRRHRALLANSITLLTNLTLGFAARLLLLAQDAGPATGAAAGDGGAQAEPSFIQNLLGNPLILPVGLFLIFYLTFLGPEKRRKADEAKLMASLEKNDRVITVGGIHGTVVSVTDSIVTLRIEEGGNTRIKINRTAIASKVVAKDKEKDS